MIAPKHISKKRMDVCKNCEHYRKWLRQCKVCGCFMPVKTKLDHAKCPIDKWGSPKNTWGGYRV